MYSMKTKRWKTYINAENNITILPNYNESVSVVYMLKYDSLARIMAKAQRPGSDPHCLGEINIKYVPFQQIYEEI